MSEPFGRRICERVLSRRAMLSGRLSAGDPSAGRCSSAAHDAPARRARLARSDVSLVARVLPAACVAFRGTACSDCVDTCPVPGAIAVEQGRPRVVSALCDGCGDCVAACQAPRGAIVRIGRDPR